MVAEYLIEHGYYSYNALSIDEDPVKQWIGREVKRFLSEAHMHIPFLLRLASAPVECHDGAVAETDGDYDPDSDDDYAPTDADLEKERQEEPTMMEHARMWDNFLNWVREIQAPWDPEDSDAYREQRATTWFMHARKCARDLHTLKPTLQSWVPHIACYVVTRQIILMGDPSRRSADSCESFGAMLKKVIKHLTCRRRLHQGSVDHIVDSCSVAADLQT